VHKILRKGTLSAQKKFTSQSAKVRGDYTWVGLKYRVRGSPVSIRKTYFRLCLYEKSWPGSTRRESTRVNFCHM